jgi:hypothetical protein
VVSSDDARRAVNGYEIADDSPQRSRSARLPSGASRAIGSGQALRGANFSL